MKKKEKIDFLNAIKAGNCKETPLTKYCSRTMPERISVEEINEVKIYPEFF